MKTLIYKDICSLCLLEHYLSEPRYGNRLYVHQQKRINKNYVLNIHDGILLSHKKDEILSCVSVEIDFEDIMLCEINQIKKDKNHMILFVCGI